MNKLFNYLKSMNLKSKILFGIWVYVMIFMTLACCLTINIRSAIYDVMILLLLYVIFTIIFLVPAIKKNNREKKENQILDNNVKQGNEYMKKTNVTCQDNVYNAETNSGIAIELKRKIANVNRANPYIDITPYELKVGFPIVKYNGFFSQANEIIVYVAPAYTFKDKEQVVGYTGKSSGVSVRVAKGLTYRTGGSGGHAIRGNVRKYNAGDLIITNKRVIFIGKDDSFEFAVNKISAVKPLTQESFVIQSGRSFKNILVDSSLTIYASGFINYVVTGYNTNLDIVAEYKQANDEMTDEQRNLCNQIKQEVLAMAYHEPKPERKKWGCFTKFMFGVMCFFLAILIGVITYGIVSVVEMNLPNQRLDSQGNLVEIQQYADMELICKEGHPLIYDTFADAKDFYADVAKDKVKVISGADHAAIERKQKSLTSDETLLYIIQDSTHEDYIGRIQINLFSSELAVDMSTEKAVELLCDYIPSWFGKYYKQDSCYRYTQGNVDVYTYSCHLNDAGIEYHNNGHFELSGYYHLKFMHYTDTNQWKLETGYAAYGNKDKGWIEKYAEPWNINMSAYFKD